MPDLDAKTRQMVIAKVLELPLGAWKAEFSQYGLFMHFAAQTAKGSLVAVSARETDHGDSMSSTTSYGLDVDGEHVDGDVHKDGLFIRTGPIQKLYQWLFKSLDVERRGQQMRQERQQREEREGRERMLGKF